jgi:cytochrome c oxidase subunit 3
MAGHDDHHDPDLAHHFENPDQQYQSARLGMWVFLVTEILFFGGLFCAYAVYRANHPEIFVFGHHFLDKNLGALNTVVLIFSSFTVAWAVRAAQLKQIKLLKLMLVLTLACAFAFLGVKYVEYSHKWHSGLLWAKSYNPHDAHHGGEEHDSDGGHEAEDTVADGATHEAEPILESITPGAEPEGDPVPQPDRSNIAPAADGPAGMAVPEEAAHDDDVVMEPENAQTFFSIYFLMTGLHGIHVLGGIGAFLWLLMCARRGDFDTGHFTKVDTVALYWHVVDLIWIYLFLLLYLID